MRVARNPETPPALLEEISRLQPPVKRALREIAQHPRATVPALASCLKDPIARPIAAGHPALPAEMIVALLDDAIPAVAEGAAANPSLPTPVMFALTRSRLEASHAATLPGTSGRSGSAASPPGAPTL
ncbi:hypothetical protein GCM10027589_35060 [Actinocorallia lasiicapitis]